MNTALNELRELERQSSVKHAPDVVLDTLEQVKHQPPPPGGAGEPISPLHGMLVHHRHGGPSPGEVQGMRRSASSNSDAMTTFKPAVAPRMGVQLKPPALRPKPMVLPKTATPPHPHSHPQPSAPPPQQEALDKSCTM